MKSHLAREGEVLPLIPVEGDASVAGPQSETRLSPRVLAAQVQHFQPSGATRMTRASLLAGDWTVQDVDRKGTELRVVLSGRPAAYSDREREVLKALFAGASDRQISDDLGITRQCVCGHLANSLGKMGAESRFHALQTWRCLEEVEKGRNGRARLAEIAANGEGLVSIRVPIPARPEIELRLSAAETHVAWLVCDGLSNREIAFVRGSAERTVANQVASIFQKLSTTRRSEVAMFLLGLR